MSQPGLTIHSRPTLNSADLNKFQEFINDLADTSRRIILELWKDGSFQEELKEDQTPVSVVDLRVEERIREVIGQRYPTHGIIGEEFPSCNPHSDFQWTIDPIDGTQNLINRIPTFGTLIGLRLQDQAVLGLIDHPVMNLRTIGGPGIGVSHNGAKVTLGDLAAPVLTPNDIVVTNNRAIFGRSENAEDLFNKVMSLHGNSRIYLDCYAHTLAVLGSVAVVVEPNLKIWDVTPVEAMMQELGGGYTRFGQSDPIGKVPLINAVFGKKTAVDLMKAHLDVKV